jgi:hypothetical protein
MCGTVVKESEERWVIDGLIDVDSVLIQSKIIS